MDQMQSLLDENIVENWDLSLPTEIATAKH
jgi:hypothetical protein